MANLLQLLQYLEGDVELAEVNLDFLNNADVKQLPPHSPGPSSQAPAQEWLELAPAAPEPAQNLLEMAMAQAELVPMQVAPALVQLATVAGTSAPELAAQALVQLALEPALAAPPPPAAVAPAAPALAAPAMLAGAPALAQAAAAQAVYPAVAGAAAEWAQGGNQGFGAGVEEEEEITGRVKFLPGQTVIIPLAGDQPILFNRPVRRYQLPPFVVDPAEFRHWAAEHGALEVSDKEVAALLSQLERRRQVLTGKRLAHWPWGPLNQPVTMGLIAMFQKLLALIAFVSEANRNIAVVFVQVYFPLSDRRVRELHNRS